MTNYIETNKELPFREVGKWFVITAKNNINGNIIFSEKTGISKAYTLNKFQRNEFDIPEMRKNEWISFDPDIIEFRTSDDIEEILIDVAPVNPLVK